MQTMLFFLRCQSNIYLVAIWFSIHFLNSWIGFLQPLGLHSSAKCTKTEWGWFWEDSLILWYWFVSRTLRCHEPPPSNQGCAVLIVVNPSGQLWTICEAAVFLTNTLSYVRLRTRYIFCCNCTSVNNYSWKCSCDPGLICKISKPDNWVTIENKINIIYRIGKVNKSLAKEATISSAYFLPEGALFFYCLRSWNLNGHFGQLKYGAAASFQDPIKMCL